MSEKWAPLYYATHTGVSGDTEFYLSQLTREMRILELGCGAGRLTRRLLEEGHEIVALDHCAYALNCVQACALELNVQARLTTVLSAFEELPTTGDFDCVIMSFNALLCLDANNKQAVFLAIARALKPGGCFLFDFYDGGDFLSVDEPDDEPWIYEPEFLKAVVHEDVVYEIYQSGTYWSAQERIVMSYDHFLEDSEDPEGTLTYEIVHHLVSLDGLRPMIESSNLVIDEIRTKDFEGSTHLFLRVAKAVS